MFLSFVCSGRLQSIKRHRFRFYLFFVLFHVTDALQMIEIAAQITQNTFHLKVFKHEHVQIFCFPSLCISQLRVHVFFLFLLELKFSCLAITVVCVSRSGESSSLAPHYVGYKKHPANRKVLCQLASSQACQGSFA